MKEIKTDLIKIVNKESYDRKIKKRKQERKDNIQMAIAIIFMFLLAIFLVYSLSKGKSEDIVTLETQTEIIQVIY